MTAVSSSSVATVLERRGLPGHRRAERLGAVDRGGRGRVGGDHEEVLAPVESAEPGVPLLGHRQVRGALEAEVRLRVGVAEVVGHLAPLEQHVERYDGRAGLEDAVVDDREVRQVRAAQGDLVAVLDAARRQQVRHLVGRAVDLRVGQPGVPEDDRLTVGESPGTVLEQGRQVVQRGLHHENAVVGPTYSRVGGGVAGPPLRPGPHRSRRPPAVEGGGQAATARRATRTDARARPPVPAPAHCAPAGCRGARRSRR